MAKVAAQHQLPPPALSDQLPLSDLYPSWPQLACRPSMPTLSWISGGITTAAFTSSEIPPLWEQQSDLLSDVLPGAAEYICPPLFWAHLGIVDKKICPLCSCGGVIAFLFLRVSGPQLSSCSLGLWVEIDDGCLVLEPPPSFLPIKHTYGVVHMVKVVCLN